MLLAADKNSSSDTDIDSQRPAEPHTFKFTFLLDHKKIRKKLGVNDNYIFVVCC